MKKDYITPEVEFIEVNQDVMTASSVYDGSSIDCDSASGLT